MSKNASKSQDASGAQSDVMENLISLCKRRGFIFQGSEIYGGLAGTWDYGPLGVALKNNIKKIWWKRFVDDRDDMYGIDAAILMTHITLEATELGLGTCWIGAFNASEARKVLMLPESVEPVAFTPLGYPISTKPLKNRKSIDNLVHWEFFGGKKHDSE